MKLSVFLGVLLPCVAGFVTPAPLGSNAGVKLPASSHVNLLRAEPRDQQSWSVKTLWEDVVGTASETKAKVDSTAAEVVSELRKKVLVRQERQKLEGQLCSLLRIGGDHISSKAEEHVRRLASELEALQASPFIESSIFGKDSVSLAGCWKLIYSSAGHDGGKASKGCDRLQSVENISYVSDHYRLSHTDTGVLRVYQRLPAPVPGTNMEDDTAQGGLTSGRSRAKAGVGKRAASSAASADHAARDQPFRKRMFFGWRR